MEFVKGQVVQSRSGRDVASWYVVVGSAKNRLLLCNGEARTLAAPKRKNPRHLSPTRTVLPGGAITTDLAIKMALKPFKAKTGPEQGG